MGAKYIYGIIENSSGTYRHEDIYTVPYKDIAAVVSDTSHVDYTTLPKVEVARYLLRHQQVIEKVMDDYTILPMKLGTYVFNNGEVEEVLSRGYSRIKEIFKSAENKIEIDMVATWNDMNAVIKEAAGDKEIMEFKQTLLNQKEGVTANDQMKIGLMVQNHLEKKKSESAMQIQASLKNTIEMIKDNELMDDTMVSNTAFLISKDKQNIFEDKIEELDAKFEDRMNFRCIGPLPLYSFYTLEIKKLQYEEVEWAKKKLGLNDYISRDEIKKAYHRHAFSSHPDRNPDEELLVHTFDDVVKAYEILGDCCLAAEQTSPGSEHSFNIQAVKENSILVKVREN